MPYADPKKQREYLTRYSRTWYWRNREKDLARQKKWRDANRMKLKAIRKKFRDSNKERLAKEQSDRRKRNPEHVALIDRRSAYKINYGITVEDFDAMLRLQKNKCAVCLSSAPGGRWSRFAVDHCHKSGKVRGLLCMSCNTTLGRYESWYSEHKSRIDAYLDKGRIIQ